MIHPSAGPRTRVRVRVPATSANLGPGFDALGLALAMHDEVDVELAAVAGGLSVEPYGRVPVDERNLVVRGLRAAFEATGGQPEGVRVRYTPRIPHSRGLGSSAAAICAGVVAGLALRGRAGTEADELALRLADGLEGHPDNVAACLFGGATIAWYAADEAGVQGAPADPVVAPAVRPRVVRLEPSAHLSPVAFVPDVRTSTERSRGALPDVVAHADAAFSAGRAALLVAALTTRPDLLLTATEDRLHQPYRLPTLPGSAALLDRLRSAAIPAVLSGSGPTVLALCRSADEVRRAVGLGEQAGPGVFGISSLPVDRQGCQLLD